MRKIHLPLLILLKLALAGTLMSQATIQLTLTGEVNGNHQPLDSVIIENLTQGGDTTLYGTDTVLVLDHGIGIEDRLSDHTNRMILYPAYPNPVTHTSTIRLWLPQDAPVSLRVFDLPGRELATYSWSLGAGEHSFTFTPGRETYYLLVVESADQRQVQKLINLNPGEGSCQLSHNGHQPAPSGMRKGKSTFPWVPGDDLRFMGFSSLGVDTIEDDPLQSGLYTFQFLPPVPPPVADFSVSDTLVYVNGTVYFFDLSTGSPTSWKWFFGDGDSSLMQHPTHIYTTTGLYSVTLIVKNAGGADTLTKYDYITIDSIGAYPPGYVHCNPSNPTAVVDVINPITGRTWMDRNLGASQAATSSTDTASFGDLYQWGRFADGHQCRTSATTTTLSSTDQPGHGNFIIAPSPPYDWRNPPNTNLWQGLFTVNNPCPLYYRVPTMAELNAERLSWSSNNLAGAFASPLKWLNTGYRRFNTGSISMPGGVDYWSSQVYSATYNYHMHMP